MTRSSTILAASIGVGALAVSSVVTPPLCLIYNGSDSAPRGLYVAMPVTSLRVNDYVVARLPSGASKLASERGYLPRTIPVLKHVAAVAGQHVCVVRGAVLIDGIAAARALLEDGQGRRLNAWDGCRRLLKDELFLLNPNHSASFDSRYFGPIDASFVRGRATPLTQAH